MTSIQLQNVCVDYPVFDASNRSFKKHLFGIATGGQIDADNNGRVIVRAIDNISLKINTGDRVGIVGHNGAGKSTLLRLLNGVYSPTSGAIVTNGEVGSLIDISLGIDPEVAGRENIYLRGGLLGLTKSQINQKIDEIIEFSELGDFIDMPLRTYSTGMKLRLAFSVSTIIKPEILIMDEWLSVGDENFKHKAEIRISELVESTNILVIATHAKDLLLKTCNRVLWLEHGRVRLDSDPEEVVRAYFG